MGSFAVSLPGDWTDRECFLFLDEFGMKFLDLVVDEATITVHVEDGEGFVLPDPRVHEPDYEWES